MQYKRKINFATYAKIITKNYKFSTNKFMK